MAIKFAVGGEFFDTLRASDSYYVDKTELVYDLVTANNTVSLFTRPRRFGKTLNMSMIQSFFDITRDSREVFEGLAVTAHGDFCREWMNQYPVVFVTLKDAEGATFDDAYDKLKAIIANVCRKLSFLETDNKVSAYDVKLFRRLQEKTSTNEELQNSLITILRMMNAVYGKPVILLIDEYDVPLSKARDHGFYPQMLDVIRGLLSTSLKTNDYLKFAVVTGCLRIAKESIFTGVNNFKSYSVVDEAFSQYFGFTEKEVNDLLATAEEGSYSETIREWYDGYVFGNTPVYCPWDVVNFVADARGKAGFEPQNYWKNSSGNGIIREFAEDERFQVADKFETLLNGGTITQTFSDELTYETLKLTEDNLWSVLVMTGYLTKANPGQTGSTVALKIPNREISAIFEESVMTLFADTVDAGKVRSLTEALWNGNEQAASEILSDLLLDTISYNDYHEDYYHAFLAGIFVGRGYGVDSNKEKALGRPDIQMTDRPTRRAVIIEAKKSDSEGQMEHDCQEALKQIMDRQYAKGLKGYKQIRCYGVAFFEKSALVKML
jgi:hypothetical protein